MGNHRAERHSRQRPAGRPTPVQGRRRAERPSRKPLPRVQLRLPGRLPAIPTLVGVVALIAAGAGAVTVHPAPPSSGAIQVASGSTALTGTDAVGFAGDPRERAISRDSERQALEDASEVKLQQAAEQQAAERNAELKSLGKAAEARAGEIAKNQWQLPTSGYRLTARFGMSGGMWSSNHTGLDFATACGHPDRRRRQRHDHRDRLRRCLRQPDHPDPRGRHRDLVLPPDRHRRLPRRHRQRRPADRHRRLHRQLHRPAPPPRGPPRRRRPGRPLPGPGLPRAQAVRRLRSSPPARSAAAGA